MNKSGVKVKKVSAVYGDCTFSFHSAMLLEENTEDEIPQLHSHTFYEMHVIGKGRRTFDLPNGKAEANENEMLIFAPLDSHYSFVGGNNEKNSILNVSLQKTNDDFHIYNAVKEKLNNLSGKPIKIPSDLINFSKELFSESVPHPLNELRDKKLAYDIAYILISLLKLPLPTLHVAPEESKKEDVCHILDILLASPSMTLEGIAETIGYTSRQTARIISKQYGMSFSEIKKERALSYAKDVLDAEKTLSVNEICRISGFKSPSSFYKAFREKFGCTPGEYREKGDKK